MLRKLENSSFNVLETSSYSNITSNKLKLLGRALSLAVTPSDKTSSISRQSCRQESEPQTPLEQLFVITGISEIQQHMPRGSCSPPLFRTDLNLPGRSPYEYEFQPMNRENSLWMFSRTWADLFESIRNWGYNCWFFAVESWRQRWLILN